MNGLLVVAWLYISAGTPMIPYDSIEKCQLVANTILQQRVTNYAVCIPGNASDELSSKKQGK